MISSYTNLADTNSRYRVLTQSNSLELQPVSQFIQTESSPCPPHQGRKSLSVAQPGLCNYFPANTSCYYLTLNSGGSILAELLKSPDEYEISALVRNEEQAAILQKVGVTPVLFSGLDDLETNRRAAAQNDGVLHLVIRI